MKVLSGVQLGQILAKALKKPVLYVSFFIPNNMFSEVLKAAPYLSSEHGQILADGYAIIVCNSFKEQERLYSLTVGDDGPTKSNPYNGPARVYALTIDKMGRTVHENT